MNKLKGNSTVIAYIQQIFTRREITCVICRNRKWPKWNFVDADRFKRYKESVGRGERRKKSVV